jgi:hypothetical protein
VSVIAEVSEDEDSGEEEVTRANWKQQLPWTKLASREQPELGQIGLIIKGKEKDGLGKLAIVLRVHAVKITVGTTARRTGRPRQACESRHR